MTLYPDQPLFDGIKKLQKDKGLFQDALMEPCGETVTAINKELANPKQIGSPYDKSKCHSVPGYSSCLEDAAKILRQYNAETDEKRKYILGSRYSQKIVECDNLCVNGLKYPPMS